MSERIKKIQNMARRTIRSRATTRGTTERPRLSVHISNRHITAQIINDETHKTLAYASTVGQKIGKKTRTEQAEMIGTELAKKAASAKVTKVVYDRSGKLYHGRVKALADAARAAGLEF